MLEKIFKRHKDWIDIVMSLGCNKDKAEDIVQDMYVKIQIRINDGLDLTYNDYDVNTWYVYKTLKSLFINHKSKEKKEIQKLIHKDVYCDETIDYDYYYNIVKEELETLNWYDKKVYQLQEETSVSDLSRKTGISYISLYNTTRKVKERLKKKLNL